MKKDPKLEIDANLGLEIKFLGNSKSKVAGSINLVRDLTVKHNATTILLDCGLSQTNDMHNDYVDNKQVFSKFKPSELDAVIISHTHLDHIGLLPALFNKGFKGIIYVPEGSVTILKYLLFDSAFIQEANARYLSTQHHDVNPLYSDRNVLQVLENLVEVPLYKDFWIENIKTGEKNVKFQYFDAGHILFSRMIQLQFIRPNPGNSKKILYTGDMGDIHEAKMSPAKKLFNLDTHVFLEYHDLIIMESTYGDRCNNLYDFQNDIRILMEALETKDKIIIPTFAQARAYEIIFTLYNSLPEKYINEFEIVVDSPLASKLTLEYLKNLSYYNHDFNNFVTNEISYPKDKKESIAAMHHVNKQIILTSAGMLSGGRSIYWVENFVDDPNVAIIFSGYVSPKTLGFMVLNDLEIVEIRDFWYKKKAFIGQFKSFSSHIHQESIIELIKKAKMANNKNFILTHGDIHAKNALIDQIKKTDGMENINVYDSARF